MALFSKLVAFVFEFATAIAALAVYADDILGF